MSEPVTRRRMAVVLGGVGLATANGQPKQSAVTIHQEVDFKAPPGRVYEILLDAKQFSAFTHVPAEIEAVPGGAFRLFGGRIEGRNVELIATHRIVQAWRSSSWPSGAYSIVRFELAPRIGGSRMVFDHTGFPEGEKEHLSEGWPLMYWEPLRKFLDA
jgi:activator of HSP90 ATPase